MRRINKLEADLVQLAETAIVAAQGPRQERAGVRRHRRLHERRQVDTAQPAHRFGRARRESPVRHARSDHAAPRPPRRRARAAVRHGRVHQPAPARAWSRASRARSKSRRTPTTSSMSSTPVRPTRWRRSTRFARCSTRSTRPGCPSCSCSTRPTWLQASPRNSSRTTPARWRSAPSTGEGVDEFLRTLGDRLRLLSTVHELSIPYDRGDVLAAVHREGEVVSIGEGHDVVDRPCPLVRRIRRTPRVVPGGGTPGGRRRDHRRPRRLRAAALSVRPARRARADRRSARRWHWSTSRSARRATRLRRRSSPRWRASDSERGYPPSIGRSPCARPPGAGCGGDSTSTSRRPTSGRRSAPRSSSSRCPSG